MNAFYMFVFSLMFFLNTQLLAKIRIFSFHINKPEFIDLQYRTFKKFMKEDYELIVFNDAKTSELENEIRDVCEKNGIQCIRYEQHWHENDPLTYQYIEWLKNPIVYNLPHIRYHFPHPNDVKAVANHPSTRHCHVIQYALDNFGYDHDDIVCIVDGDMFPIRPFSVESLLGKNDIIGVQKVVGDVDYLWVIFIAFHPQKLPKSDLKFNGTIINNKLHDSGSNTYYYLKNHPEVKSKKYSGHTSQNLYEYSASFLHSQGFEKKEIKLIKSLPKNTCVEFHLENRFLHFLGSSFDLEEYKEKERLVKEFIEELLIN